MTSGGAGSPRKSAAWFRDPELAMSAMATLHAILGASFGFSLIYSGVRGLDTASPAYRFITALPGWPWSVGVLYFLLGIGQLWANLGKNKHSGWSAIFFGASAVTVGMYAGLYLVGTVTAHAATIVGPQVTYLMLSGLYGVHAAYSAARWADNGGD